MSQDLRDLRHFGDNSLRSDSKIRHILINEIWTNKRPIDHPPRKGNI